MQKLNRDDYFVIHTRMSSGFECLIPARGFNLKSWLAFEDKLGATYTYEKVTEKVYQHLTLGDPDCPLPVPADVESKTSTKPSTSSAKAKPSAKTATKKPSATKPSVAAAKKTTAKKVSSSKTKPKPSTGSTRKKTDDPSKPTRVRKA